MTDTLLAIGQVCTSEGALQWANGLGQVDEVAWCPAVNYRRSQPPAVATIAHCPDWQVGSVVAYQRSRRSGLLAALTIRSDHRDFLTGDNWYLSPDVHWDAPNPMQKERAEIRTLSIVRTPASAQTRPLCFASLDAFRSPQGMPWDGEKLWTRAKGLALGARYRSAPKSLEVDDLDELTIVEEMATDKEAGRLRLDAALAAHRRSDPTIKGSDRAPSVTLYGRKLDPQQSQLVLDLLEFG
jgi:hypothetical protein